MIKTFLRTVAAVVAGFVAAFLLVVAVEAFSAIVHPVPEDCGHTPEEICRHIENYPQWVLAAVVPMWGFTAFGGAWIARKLGNLASAAIVGLLLFAAVGSNLAMLPYPGWFKVANVLMVPMAIIAGGRSGERRGSSGGASPITPI